MNEYVWIRPKEENSDLPIGARVLATFDSRIKVKDDENKEYWISGEDILRPMHPSSVSGVDDMITLGELQEYSILRNLQIRYMKDFIYTYVGSMLVAVNPYKSLPIYGKSKMIDYRKKRLGELSPHVFAVADHSYESMRKKSEKRCIIISGESGSGKTESTKLLLQYFARISPRQCGKEQQILDSNPILEAFGNAKTMRNDNSSRFGKYVEIYFTSSGSIESAQIKHYLLEKSRIVSQSKNEQNYHIFYVILSGMTAEEKLRLGLKGASHYNYLNRAQNIKETVEANDISYIKSAMKVLNFSDTEIWNIFELVAAILHFGNVQYEATCIGNVEAVEIMKTEEIESICRILRVSNPRLCNSLTKKTISTQSDVVVKFLSKQQALDSRDAFVKKIYRNLFTFIVDKINESLSKDKKTANGYIGILDIFGFEAFDRNSFEQLCINYANEKLQQFFVKYTFQNEQEQYAIEGIDWKYIQYTDNKDILDLIEIGPSSILSVINDESKFPQGSDQKMLNKLIKFHSKNNFFLKPKFKNTEVFGIKHYAGAVLYDVENFLEKNHDTCNEDMKQVVHSSSNKFLKQIFANDFEMESQPNHKKRTETLASKFKSSLDMLMNELTQCEPFFVRCIKPNEDKRPQKFDRILCWKQLKYSGMTETTKVREAGYPLRYDYVQFVQRYRVLCPGTPLAHKTSCKETTKKICQIVFRNFPKADIQFGRTKVFLKYREELFLEQERNKALHAHVVIIQKVCRRWLEQRRYKKLKKAVFMVENCWIRRKNRLEGDKIRRGFYRLQAKLRSRTLRFIFQYQRYLITRLQAHCRGYLIRSFVRKKLELAGPKNKLVATEEETSSFTFQKYAKLYFQKKIDHKFSKKPIKTSLTYLVNSDDVIAAKALWLTILRYTKNVKEPAKSEPKVPVKTQLREILERINKKKKSIPKLPENSQQLYENWLKTRTGDLDKLHFIVGHGIVRDELRDEIYSQICKIITKNPSQKSVSRGWDILNSCVGCFPPSDLLLKYLKTFIREGPKEHASFASFRLHRVFQNGPRTQPPCHTEIQAIRKQKPIRLEVLLTNGTAFSLKVDSSVTAREMLEMVAKVLYLSDPFGFSIFIVHEMKHSPVGDGSNFVLDAIADCEQYAMEIGHTFENSPWKLVLKKEMFAPWHEYTVDEISSLLICHQISQGIKAGEYVCDAEDLCSLVAHICYAERGSLRQPLLGQVIDEYIPNYIRNSSEHEIKFFKEQVAMIYKQKFGKNQRAKNSVLRDIMEYAMKFLHLHFSKFFHLFGSIRNVKSCLCYPHTPLTIAVHSTGMMIIDESNEKRLILELEFMEIREIIRKETAEGQGHTLNIITYGGVEISLELQTVFDSDFHELLVRIIDTLKKYSKYAICIKDYKATDKSFLDLQKGDLIIFNENLTGRDLLWKSNSEGTNVRSGISGKFLHDYVDIIPTVNKPSESILRDIRSARSPSKINQPCAHAERLKHYTLESYAEKHFTVTNSKGRPNQDLWRYNNENIQQPLLAIVANDEKLSVEALHSFQAILHYTEKQPEKITDDESTIKKILSPALQNDALKDEVYCAVMKQLTSNTNRKSEDRCWELMWLMTGIFPCSDTLAREVKKFLQSRRTVQTARECLARFYKILRSAPRKYLPHLIEIEAVQRRPCKILYKVYFPDDTHKFFQINSQTKTSELIQDVLNRLKLKATKGFNLYVQIVKRFFLIPTDYYIFDYFQHLKNWTDKNTMTNENAKYQIYLMKSHWKDVIPGHDKLIDLKFLYPQEYKKYIQGLHQIPQEEIVQVAALLYRIQFKEKTQQLQLGLQELIPSNIIHLKKPEVWQKEIQSIHSTQSPMSEENAKIEFLKYLYRLPSYGLQYFTTTSVKSNQPDYILYPVTVN